MIHQFESDHKMLKFDYVADEDVKNAEMIQVSKRICNQGNYTKFNDFHVNIN